MGSGAREGGKRGSWEAGAPASRSVGAGGRAGGFWLTPGSRPELPLATAARPLSLRCWFRGTCCSRGARAGGKTRLLLEGSFLLLSSPPLGFLPAPDSSAFVFQVGSHFHLQVSDKPAQPSPTRAGPSQTGEGAGVELSGRR